MGSGCPLALALRGVWQVDIDLSDLVFGDDILNVAVRNFMFTCTVSQALVRKVEVRGKVREEPGCCPCSGSHRPALPMLREDLGKGGEKLEFHVSAVSRTF